MCFLSHLFIIVVIIESTKQIIKIGTVLALLRVHRPNIRPYMSMHWADFYYLSDIIRLLFSLSIILLRLIFLYAIHQSSTNRRKDYFNVFKDVFVRNGLLISRMKRTSLSTFVISYFCLSMHSSTKNIIKQMALCGVILQSYFIVLPG